MARGGMLSFPSLIVAIADCTYITGLHERRV